MTLQNKVGRRIIADGTAEGVRAEQSEPHEAMKASQNVHVDRSQPVVFKVGLLKDEYWTWVHTPEAGQPRFFASSLVEACSKTPWWVVPLVWLPIFTAILVHSHVKLAVSVPSLISWICAGVVAWQLLEYVIHRFVFHAHPKSYWGITFHFLFHGCHHKYPMDGLRLVFPPVPASLLVMLVYVVLSSTLPCHHALPLFSGMGYGYVAYDCLHYAVHHLGSRSMPVQLFRELKQRHMHHHYHDPDHGYGISSILFDVVFNTCATLTPLKGSMSRS
mmetsp:Transcript_17496/g.37805  ORF Transcript_17496/g.37805 Transcript_17496/m.37805 type:complete len:274 (-) Transcript_17496:530-1351(-)